MATAEKILVMGLPGSGKTTLARLLTARLRAVHFNGDEVRAEINRDLGFALADRIEQARRIGWLCDRVVAAGHPALADFVCPTAATRRAFGATFVVWLDRIAAGRYADTNRLFEPPLAYDVRVSRDGSPETWADEIAGRLARARSGNASPQAACGSSALPQQRGR